MELQLSSVLLACVRPLNNCMHVAYEKIKIDHLSTKLQFPLYMIDSPILKNIVKIMNKTFFLTYFRNVYILKNLYLGNVFNVVKTKNNGFFFNVSRIKFH